MCEALKQLVIERRILDYQYFMDEAQLYEIAILQEMIPYADKSDWERMRWIVWSNFKSTGCKVPSKPNKLMPFTTDDDYVEYSDREELDYVGQVIKNIFKHKDGKQSIS